MTSPDNAGRTTPRHPIAVVTERTGLSQDLLRVWERRYRAVSPTRGPGGQRLYSDADIERLQLIQKLTTDLGLNLAGVELVLRLEDELQKAHARIDRLQRQLRDEVQNVHRQYRRDLVLYREDLLPERQ